MIDNECLMMNEKLNRECVKMMGDRRRRPDLLLEHLGEEHSNELLTAEKVPDAVGRSLTNLR